MITREEMFLEICKVLSQRSTCQRAHVGCVITLNHRIISTGLNGPLSSDMECFGYCKKEDPCLHAIHAEANAIYAAAKEGISLQGATLYCNFSPCMKCAEAIIQSGIKTVVYKEEYREPSPLIRLRMAGIICQQIGHGVKIKV